MKFAFEEEDSIYAILLGVFLMASTGLFFSIPYITNAPYIRWIGIPAFIIAIILSFLDVIHTMHDLSFHPILLIFAFLNNIVDILLEFALVLTFIGISPNIPYFTQYVMPLASTEMGIFGIGVFFTVTGVFWLISFFFR